MVAMAAAAREQLLGFFAAVASEEAMQQIDHRPQMARLLDVDLEQVAEVVQRRRGLAQMALLLDRGRFGVALGHDDAAQLLAELARDLLPRVGVRIVAETDLAVLR